MSAKSPAAIARWEETRRRTSREAKRRRTGTCEVCGGVTRYNGHREPISRVCIRCSATAVSVARRGTGHAQQRALDLLAAHGELRFKQWADLLGVSTGYMAQLQHRLLRYGLIVRVRRGVYALPEEPS